MWTTNFVRMSSKVTGGLPRSSLKFKSFVILMKNVLFLSETSSHFSLSNILFEFNLLLLKYGLIVFQNFLMSDKSFTSTFWKYSLLVSRNSVTQKFRCFFIICPIYIRLFCYKCFLILIYAKLLFLSLWTWNDYY